MPKSARQKKRERKVRYQREKLLVEERNQRETQLKQQLILGERQERKAHQHQLYVKITRWSRVKQQQYWPFMCKICNHRCFGSFAVYRQHLNGHKRWLQGNFYRRFQFKKSRTSRISSNLSQSNQSERKRSSARPHSKRSGSRISTSPSKKCSGCSSTGSQSKQFRRKSSSTQSKQSRRKSSSTGSLSRKTERKISSTESLSKQSGRKRSSTGAPSKRSKKKRDHGQRFILPKTGYRVAVRQDSTLDVQFGNVNFKCSHCFGFFPDINAFMKHSLVVHSGAISCVCYRCKESFADEAALKLHEKMHQDSNMPPSPSKPVDNVALSAEPPPSKPVDKVAPSADLLKCPTPNCGAMYDNVDNFRSHTARCRKNAHYKVQSEYGKDQESWVTLECGTMLIRSKPPSAIPPQHQDSSGTSEKPPSSVFKVKLTNVDSSNQGGTSSVRGDTKQLEYSCCSCKESFSKPDELIKHHTEVHTEFPSCKICGKQFGSVSFLELHMSKDHKIEGQISNTKREVLENTEHKMEGQLSNIKQEILENTEQGHQAVGVVRKTASGQHHYECRYCPKVFSSMETLEGHVERRHWVCTECGKVCKPKEAQKHKAEHKADDPSKGDTIDVEINTKADEITNEFSHPKEKAHTDENIAVSDAVSKTDHKCTNCSKTFADEKTLQIHQVCHTSVSVHLYQEAFINELVKKSGNYFPGHPSDCRCSKCRRVAAASQAPDAASGGIEGKEGGTELTDLKNLNTNITPSHRSEKNHKKESNALQSKGVTEDEAGQYPCDQCDKRFSSKRYQAQHRDWHSGRYRCDECGKHCQSANILKLHKRKHTDETYCSCKKCGQGFKHERSLKEHICRPAGEVGKTEAEGEEVKTVRPTKRTASNYKPRRSSSSAWKANQTVHQCPDCKECFTDEPALEIHKICHTSDKQYLCILCVKSFGDLNNLLKHIMEDKAHEKLDSCPICGKQIKTRKSIPEHVLGHYGVQPYPCDQCDKRFSSKAYFRQHRAWHSGKYACDECGKHCQSATILKLHKRKHTDESYCTCKICGQGFKHEKSLKTHICGSSGKVLIKTEFSQIEEVVKIKREKPKSFICRFCGSAYTRGDSLRLHERIKHSTAPHKSYSCTQCNKPYLSQEGLRYHVKAAHTEGGFPKPHMCCECGKCFPSSILLKYHILSIHKKISRHQCSFCGQRFFHRTVMLTHIKGKHTNDKKHVCEICGKRFVARTELVNHTRSHTQERPYKCQHCGRGFNIASQRKNHERLHTNELPYECDVCHVRFRTAEILNHHKKIQHDNNNPHVCTFCNKKCATAGSLKVHMNYHTKPFMCTLCGTGFGKKSSVKDHEKRCAAGGVRMQFNRKRRRYQCDMCHKNFDRPSKLENHIRIHTGELPYPCSECGDKFRTGKLRSVHKKTSHPELYQFVCTICNGGFTTSSRLAEHMREHTKPCKCLICGKGFPRNSKLKLHMNKHTMEKTGGKGKEKKQDTSKQFQKIFAAAVLSEQTLDSTENPQDPADVMTGGQSDEKKRDTSKQFQETFAAAAQLEEKLEKENPVDPADVKKEIHDLDHGNFLIENILQSGTELGRMDDGRQPSSPPRVITESLVEVKFQPHQGEVKDEHFWAGRSPGPTFCNL